MLRRWLLSCESNQRPSSKPGTLVTLSHPTPGEQVTSSTGIFSAGRSTGTVTPRLTARLTTASQCATRWNPASAAPESGKPTEYSIGNLHSLTVKASVDMTRLASAGQGGPRRPTSFVLAPRLPRPRADDGDSAPDLPQPEVGSLE